MSLGHVILAPGFRTVPVCSLLFRVLAHPHVNEQPFTRSLKGVKVPAGIERVLIRAHDSVHGYGSQVVELTLPTVT